MIFYIERHQKKSLQFVWTKPNASFMDLDNFLRQNDFIEVRLIGGFRQDCRKTSYYCGGKGSWTTVGPFFAEKIFFHGLSKVTRKWTGSTFRVYRSSTELSLCVFRPFWRRILLLKKKVLRHFLDDQKSHIFAISNVGFGIEVWGRYWPIIGRDVADKARPRLQSHRNFLCHLIPRIRDFI